MYMCCVDECGYNPFTKWDAPPNFFIKCVVVFFLIPGSNKIRRWWKEVREPSGPPVGLEISGTFGACRAGGWLFWGTKK